MDRCRHRHAESRRGQEDGQEGRRGTGSRRTESETESGHECRQILRRRVLKGVAFWEADQAHHDRGHATRWKDGSQVRKEDGSRPSPAAEKRGKKAKDDGTARRQSWNIAARRRSYQAEGQA